MLAGAGLERLVQPRAIGQPVFRHGSLDVSQDEVGEGAARESEQIADARGDDVVDVRIRDDFLEDMGEVFENDDATGAGVLKLVAELTCRV